MKFLLIALTLLSSLSAFATQPCKVFTEGVVGNNNPEFIETGLDDIKFSARVSDDISVSLSGVSSSFEIELYDRNLGVRTSSKGTLTYKTGQAGLGEEMISVNVYCN